MKNILYFCTYNRYHAFFKNIFIIHQQNRKQTSVFVFNELLKKLLSRLLQNLVMNIFRNLVLKKDAPNYHNYVQTTMCFADSESKANNIEYTTILKFFSDEMNIDTNCRSCNTGRNNRLIALSI